MARVETIQAIEVITEAKSLISKGWCKDSWAQDSSGNKIHYLDHGAIKFDLGGAIFKSCEELSNPERDIVMLVISSTLLQELKARDVNSSTMIMFNDSCENKEQVLNMLDKISANLSSALISDE